VTQHNVRFSPISLDTASRLCEGIENTVFLWVGLFSISCKMKNFACRYSYHTRHIAEADYQNRRRTGTFMTNLHWWHLAESDKFSNMTATDDDDCVNYAVITAADSDLQVHCMAGTANLNDDKRSSELKGSHHTFSAALDADLPFMFNVFLFFLPELSLLYLAKQTQMTRHSRSRTNMSFRCNKITQNYIVEVAIYELCHKADTKVHIIWKDMAEQSGHYISAINC